MTGTAIVTDVKTCARCGENHVALTFAPLLNPVQEQSFLPQSVFTHWAPCPTNSEPILLLITTEAS